MGGERGCYPLVELPVSTAEIGVHKERERQVGIGFDANHDDQHTDGSIARCAAWILICCQIGGNSDWAFDRAVHIVGKHGYRKRLEIAAAMLVAELERIDRLPKEEKGTNENRTDGVSKTGVDGDSK